MSYHGSSRGWLGWRWGVLELMPPKEFMQSQNGLFTVVVYNSQVTSFREAKPWNPALNMCILCCHEEKGNVCKSLSCFSIKEGELALILPTPDLSAKSKRALGSALLFAYSNNTEHLPCATDGWYTYVPKGIQKSRQHKTAR